MRERGKEILNKDIREILGDIYKNKERKRKKTPWFLIAILVLISSFLGAYFGDLVRFRAEDNFFGLRNYFSVEEKKEEREGRAVPEGYEVEMKESYEKQIIEVVEKSIPSVVSIIITKEVPVYEKQNINPFEGFEDFFGGGVPFEFNIPELKQKGTEKKKIGGGTGFIVSKEGLILTNKHVVANNDANFTVVTSEGERFEAKVLARDPFQDLAILQTIAKDGREFPNINLGDSDNLKIGQTAIAIGNALGEFRNTVSVGVISGLGRQIVATGGGVVETLEGVIQTDAAINQGNSGGPLLNLKGEVIGINVAVAQQAQGIGFSIPINRAKRDIEQVSQTGKIVYPFLGVRYVLITPEVQEERGLKVGYGALLVGGDAGESAVIENSAADNAGLKEEDIILEVNKEKITKERSLSHIVRKYEPGEKIDLLVLRNGNFLNLVAELGEKTSEE